MKKFYIKLLYIKGIDRFLSVLLIFTFLTGVSFFCVFKNENTVKAAQADVAKIIIIDAGHGGEDPGALSKNGELEKDLNLSVALTLGELLEKEGFVVVYTRTEDKMLYLPEENVRGKRKRSDLRERKRIAESYPEAIFISIHMNSFSDERYSGLQVYYSGKNGESELLASKIQSSVKNKLQKNNERKTKPGKDIYLLENIENTAVLIECGFLSNEEEAALLSQKEYQKELSFSIFCGIIEYIKGQKGV